MVAIAVATLFGYLWMGGAGAALFAAFGLWSRMGPGRRWAMGRGMLMTVMAVVAILPSLLWLAGYLRPGFAVAMLDTLAPTADRVLGLTAADGKAMALLTKKGMAQRFPAIRLGLASSWLCALPTAACITLLWRDKPPEKRWGRDGKYFDPMTLLFTGLPLFLLLSALLVAGYGPQRRGSLSEGSGVLFQPMLSWLWLCCVGALRSWANWWFAPDAPGKAPPTP